MATSGPRRPARARVRARRRLGAWFDRAATLAGPHLERGPHWLTGGLRRVVARRRLADPSRLMDYGPDWPPAPHPPPYPHTLLRRCVATLVLYAVIWALGSTLLELRLFELRNLGDAPVTTYTTVTTPHHR